MSAVLASLAVVAGLVTLTPAMMPLVVFEKYEFREVGNSEDATIWPLEEIAPDTRQYTNTEPRILYQIGVSVPMKKKNKKKQTSAETYTLFVRGKAHHPNFAIHFKRPNTSTNRQVSIVQSQLSNEVPNLTVVIFLSGSEQETSKRSKKKNKVPIS